MNCYQKQKKEGEQTSLPAHLFYDRRETSCISVFYTEVKNDLTVSLSEVQIFRLKTVVYL